MKEITHISRLSWGDRIVLVGVSITIIWFTWVLHTNHVEHFQRTEQWYREDRKEADLKWNSLQEKFHDHDKEIGKLEKNYYNMGLKLERKINTYGKSQKRYI